MKPEMLSRGWFALGIRLSLFPVDPWEAPPDLWQRVVGALPDADQNQPKERIRIQTGQWRDGTLQLTASPLAIAWLASPAPTQEGFPRLDHWTVKEVLPDFRLITRAWLTSIDFDIKRLGFGLHGLLDAEDRISAYNLLQQLVFSVKIDSEATSDFMYQINRPISSRSLGGRLRLNRLMKFSAPLFRVAHVQLAPAGALQTADLATQQYAGLEIDVNTPAERSEPLEKACLGAIYDELVDLALNNLEFGELGDRL